MSSRTIPLQSLAHQLPRKVQAQPSASQAKLHACFRGRRSPYPARFRTQHNTLLHEQVSSSNRGIRTVLQTKASVQEAGGVEFPEESSQGLKCIGAGVRVKKVAFINVSVYAFALYVEAEAAKAELAAGASLLSGTFDKALCLEFVRDVDATTFWEALDEAVKPRIARLATDAATASDADGNFMAEVAEAAEVEEEKASDDLLELGDFFMKKNKLTKVARLPPAHSQRNVRLLSIAVILGIYVFCQHAELLCAQVLSHWV
ncbi:hypothetical protein CYMTET_30547 [Cymbomonas tetramitiformis]|uniref:Chalcone-flavonone isomerase family protein n=1 Tax=Cymbomonas tetramitiformis TaxID=36881 RepID=A0AAE0KTT8_9CHLO|nr:hypothetical protein CYMTET_30547 [Cymbomonas tetramitiformis]